MKRNSIIAKVCLVGTVWGLLNVASSLFVKPNISLELIWVFLAALYAVGWGYWSEDDS